MEFNDFITSIVVNLFTPMKLASGPYGRSSTDLKQGIPLISERFGWTAHIGP